MIIELLAKALNKERLAVAQPADCPKVFCENEYRDYNVKKEKQY